MTDGSTPLLGERSPLARRWLRAFWVSILAGYVVVFAIAFPRVGAEDHDQQLVFHEIQVWNQQYFGLDRQWTPVMGGGMSAAGDPQIPVLSPAALAGYAVGPFWGMRIVSILWFALGFLAAFLYAGLWFRDREARAMAAALFIGNGFFVCHYGYGHVPFLPFLGFPLLLWALHRAEPWAQCESGGRRALRRVFAVLALGGFLALQLDGSAQALVYMLPWIGIYALGLAIARRSLAPLVLFGTALVVTAFLDAAFLWPLVDSQQMYPRLRPGQFTNPLALLLFLLVPFRGMFPWLPTAQNGYELSVFVGVVVAWAIVRHGRYLLARMPRDLRIPLIVTTVASVLFGMGSLLPLGVPKFLSPYDWLRELPGFKSIVVTGRFWGFLALPLSLLGAAALWRLICAQRRPQMLVFLMLLGIGLQLGFQVGTVGPKLLKSRIHEPVNTEGLFEGSGERVSYVRIDDDDFQGRHITPTTGVINAFNLTDFLRPEMQEGSVLVSQAKTMVLSEGRIPSLDASDYEGRFETWSRIAITRKRRKPLDDDLAHHVVLSLVLNQAWHPYWTIRPGRIKRDERNNLVAVVAPRDFDSGPVILEFRDRVSEVSTRVSLIAWAIALTLLLALGFYVRPQRR